MSAKPSRRRGFSLLEVLAIIMLTGVVLSMTAGLMARVTGVHRQMKAALRDSQGLEPLLQQLRDDVHRARRADLSDDASTLRLQLPGGSRQYRLAEDRIEVVARDRAGAIEFRDRAPWPLSRWSLADGVVELVAAERPSGRQFAAALGASTARQLGHAAPAAAAPLILRPLQPPVEESP